MKSILIIGAGGHGQVVAEIAEDCGYLKIDYLDDNSDLAIGKINEMDKFRSEYEEAFVGISNNEYRGQLLEKLLRFGYKVPLLIHPSAYVSKTANMGMGTVVEPGAIINAHSVIGEGTIIGSGAVVDHNAVIGQCSHINSGAIVKAGVRIESYRKLEAGEIGSGYESAIINKNGE